MHLELCLKLQDDFENWYSSLKLGTPNRHGAYNGLNLAGFDPATALMQCKDGAEFSLSRHISSLPVQYVVRAPSTGSLPNLVKRYPFLLKPGPANPKSWEISFYGNRSSRFRDSLRPALHGTLRHPGCSPSLLPTVQDLQPRFRLQQGSEADRLRQTLHPAHLHGA